MKAADKLQALSALKTGYERGKVLRNKADQIHALDEYTYFELLHPNLHGRTM